jgi:hypothetical protein
LSAIDPQRRKRVGGRGKRGLGKKKGKTKWVPTVKTIKDKYGWDKTGPVIMREKTEVQEAQTEPTPEQNSTADTH